jgi:pyruvate,orthophosphate dikinase
VIAVDGTSGEVVLGRPRLTEAAADPRLHRLLAWADAVAGTTAEHGEAVRLSAAQAVLRRQRPD